MQVPSMRNPASKIINRRFLKKKSESHLEWSSGNSYSFSRKAVAIKNRSLAALEPTSNRLLKKRFVSKGVMTDVNQNDLQQKIKALTMQKGDLSKKLETKRSQMIELNLKYLNLKEKYDIQRGHPDNQSNFSEFGDISNISTSQINHTLNNTSMSRKSKAEQLQAIKARLERMNLKKIEERRLHEEVLPKDI